MTYPIAPAPDGPPPSRLPWVRAHTRLLVDLAREYERTRPFDGLTIATAIHLEPKTASLLLTLRAGGARVVATGNLNSTQPATVADLEARGVEVVPFAPRAADEHRAALDRLLDARPHLLLDNGADLFLRFLERPFEGLLGGTEETTSGRARLAPRRADLKRPVLVINDSPIKQFAENEHAVGQSVLESFLRLTNRATNGLRVAVFGYGPCGRGVAANFRAAHAQVSVVDTDPVKRLQAHLDGHRTPPAPEALRGADAVVTVTGAPGVLTAAHLDVLRDGAVLLNAGHFPHEIDAPGLLADPRVERAEEAEGVTTLRLRDGRAVHLLGGGHMVNLAGPRALGNSIESMDLGFALQARCLEAIAAGRVPADACVVPVPADIDAAVANAFLDARYGPA